MVLYRMTLLVGQILVQIVQTMIRHGRRLVDKLGTKRSVVHSLISVPRKPLWNL